MVTMNGICVNFSLIKKNHTPWHAPAHIVSSYCLLRKLLLCCKSLQTSPCSQRQHMVLWNNKYDKWTTEHYIYYKYKWKKKKKYVWKKGNVCIDFWAPWCTPKSTSLVLGVCKNKELIKHKKWGSQQSMTDIYFYVVSYVSPQPTPMKSL